MSDIKFYPDDEIVALIRGLDRAEDAHAFAEDVTQTHPNLAADYRRVCPQRADLALCEERARSGAYGHDAKLKPLRADIALMVSNCVRFNGKEHPLAAVAQAFEHFAHDELDRYIASKTGGRRLSSLRLKSLHSTATAVSSSSSSGMQHESGKAGRRHSRGSSSRDDEVHVNDEGEESGQRTGMMHRRGAGSTTVRMPTTAELVDLVHSLARREDAGAFEVDVAEVYPELRVAYELACPQRMNLAMMRARAESGYYVQTRVERDGPTMSESAGNGLDSAQSTTHNEDNNDNEMVNNEERTNHNEPTIVQGTTDQIEASADANPNTIHGNHTNGVNTNGASAEAEKVDRAVQEDPVFGYCTADSLPRMRADVELIVRNCVTFNARIETWVKLARSFQRFAHRKIDDFVIRHAPHLRGSVSGVERYAPSVSGALHHAADTAKRRRTLSESGRMPAVHAALHTRRLDGSSSSSSSAAAAAAAASSAMSGLPLYNNTSHSPPDNNRYEHTTTNNSSRDYSVDASMSHDEEMLYDYHDGSDESRHAESDEALKVNPTPLQPSLSMAASLRLRLLRDHVQRDHLSLRRIGQSVSVKECVMMRTYAPVDSAAAEKTEKTMMNAMTEDEGTETEKEKTDGRAGIVTHASESVDGDARVRLTADYAVDTVLDRFVASVRRFYARQRSRADFHCVFDYDVHEEHMYVDWVRIVREQFNRLLQVLLLYPREAAEAHSLVAECALQTTSHRANYMQQHHQQMQQQQQQQQQTECGATEESTGMSVRWSAHLHVSYLVRFLVQFPQIASLCCATASQGSMPAPSHAPSLTGAANDAVVLCISKDALAMLKRVTRITSECLQFIADYESRLAEQIASASASS